MQESFAELAVVIEKFKKARRESALFSALARLDQWLEKPFGLLSRKQNRRTGEEENNDQR